MKNISDAKNNQENPQEIYNKMLEHYVSILDNFSYLSGTEGVVYFVDDDFVVKEYYNSCINEEKFDMYCKEIRRFSERGLAVPKIYAWAKCKRTDKFYPKYYILEERAKGQKLFKDIIDIYPRVKDKMTTIDFHKALFDKKNYPELYSKVLLEYLTEINETTSQIANMSDENVESFVLSLYELYVSCLYSYPDVFENNILFDGEKFTFLDQYMRMHTLSEESHSDSKYKIIDDLFILLERLRDIKSEEVLDINYKARVQKVKKMIEKNKYDIALRFTKKVKTTLKPETNTNFFRSLKYFLGPKRAKSIIDELERS